MSESNEWGYDGDEGFYVKNSVEQTQSDVVGALNALEARATAAEAERDRLKTQAQKSWFDGRVYLDHLRNLLARIHRDGGHYTEEHGLEKSVEDAHQVWADLRLQAEAKVAAEERLQVAVDVIASYPRIQLLKNFPHLTPTSWEQAALTALDAARDGTAPNPEPVSGDNDAQET